METILAILGLIVQYGLFVILFGMGFFVGGYIEKRHYKDIHRRERELLHLPAVSMSWKALHQENAYQVPVVEARMVYGSVVLSEDYFKAFLLALRTFFGGRIVAYETLIDRARREAILRMKAQAVGADIIVNTRLDTSTIGGGDVKAKTTKSIEVLAFGTALTFQKQPDGAA